MKDGNWQEAYDAYSGLVLDPADDPLKAPEDLANAVQCLRSLNKISAFDDFVEKVVAAHPEEWRVLSAAAEQYRMTEHNGYIIAGKFERGGHRGGGKWMNAFERDRVRALQLTEAAMGKLGAQEPAPVAADFYRTFSRALVGRRGYNEAWRLQYLTDLTKLPD